MVRFYGDNDDILDHAEVREFVRRENARCRGKQRSRRKHSLQHSDNRQHRIMRQEPVDFSTTRWKHEGYLLP